MAVALFSALKYPWLTAVTHNRRTANSRVAGFAEGLHFSGETFN